LNNSKFKIFSVDSFGITWAFYPEPTSLPSESKHNGEKMATAKYWVARKRVTFNLLDMKKMAKDKFSLITRANKHVK
jgi:hypothetical protein